MQLRFLFLVILVFFISLNSFSQGCSDAGFCTLGAMKPNQNYSRKVNLKLRSIEFNTYYGLTMFHLAVYNMSADVNIGITDKITAQVKLPYQYVDGLLANTHGLGDISLSATRNIFSTDKFQINFSLGAKIPTGKSNKKSDEGLPLPSYYQTTLGTWDFIAGVSLITKNWLFATGYQQALNHNGNEFLWGPWRNNEDKIIADRYPKSKHILRGKDLMFRVERNFRFSNWNVYAGILWIHRITKDNFLDADNMPKDVKNSDGPAISLLFGGGYRFNTHSAIKLMVGLNAKVLFDIDYIKRISVFPQGGKEVDFERNPDGLSRKYVASIGYEYRF